ncbi:MAG TPA: 2-hydroxyacid dehydrogenase [Streptosporangiaceae bacterium]|jgi:phosphoglycerate dehydrogenase-like enzyme
MSPRTVLTFSAPSEQRRAIADILEPFGKIAFLADAGEDPGARAAMLRPAEALIVGHPGRELTAADRESLGRVGLIQLVSAGVDHVDFAALPPGAVVAGNVGAFADPIAEHVLGMTLALAKRLARGHAMLAAGSFDELDTLRLRGGTAGIVGYGGIGRASARLLRALGMTIYAVNTSGRADEHADRAGTLADLPGVLAQADVLVLALPLTRATRGLIGAAELGLMKPQAILVNVARGAIVDEDALFAHLQAHPEFCAGIDTWWDEPRHGEPFRPRLPFLSLPNVLGSPHNSGDVPGIGVESLATAARNVAAFLRGDPPRGVQDPADYAAQPT